MDLHLQELTHVLLILFYLPLSLQPINLLRLNFYKLRIEKKLPDYLIACVGGGSNAMGLFYPFLNDKNVQIIGVEAAGKGPKTNQTAATMTSIP